MPSSIVNGWHTLRPAILAQLTAITQFAFVDDKFTEDVTGYPAIMFEPSTDPSDFATNREDMHTYTFNIYILQEMEKVGRDEAVRILASAVDAVTYSFLNDDTIGGACLFSKPVPSEWGEAITGHGMAKWAKLTLKCVVLHEIT